MEHCYNCCGDICVNCEGHADDRDIDPGCPLDVACIDSEWLCTKTNFCT